MTLPDLIEYFSNDNTFESFCNTHRLEGDAESIELYMQKPFGLNGKVEFFRVEETRGQYQYSYNGAEFYSLFNFYYFLNALKRELQDETKSDIDIALRLIDFAERRD